jgi:type II secretory pathway component PulF
LLKGDKIMPLFIYEARDSSGKLVRDTIDAENVRTATQKLMEQRFTVINIKEKGASSGCVSVFIIALLLGLIASMW